MLVRSQLYIFELTHEFSLLIFQHKSLQFRLHAIQRGMILILINHPLSAAYNYIFSTLNTHTHLFKSSHFVDNTSLQHLCNLFFKLALMIQKY